MLLIEKFQILILLYFFFSFVDDEEDKQEHNNNKKLPSDNKPVENACDSYLKITQDLNHNKIQEFWRCFSSSNRQKIIQFINLGK